MIYYRDIFVVDIYHSIIWYCVDADDIDNISLKQRFF